MVRYKSFKGCDLKGLETASQLEPFWIRKQPSACRALAPQFGWARMLTITIAKAQHSSQPPKRRRALLASNPLRNRRLETQRNDEGAAGTSPLFHAQPRCDRFPHTSKTPSVGFTNPVRHPQILLKSQYLGVPLFS